MLEMLLSCVSKFDNVDISTETFTYTVSTTWLLNDKYMHAMASTLTLSEAYR